jgi:hypothetical protein
MGVTGQTLYIEALATHRFNLKVASNEVGLSNRIPTTTSLGL